MVVGHAYSQNAMIEREKGGNPNGPVTPLHRHPHLSSDIRPLALELVAVPSDSLGFVGLILSYLD
jgi:hypothetical protein